MYGGGEGGRVRGKEWICGVCVCVVGKGSKCEWVGFCVYYLVILLP